MTLPERVEELIHKVAWKTGEEATPIYLAEFEQVRAEGENAGLEKAAEIVIKRSSPHGDYLAERIRAAKSEEPRAKES